MYIDPSGLTAVPYSGIFLPPIRPLPGSVMEMAREMFSQESGNNVSTNMSMSYEGLRWLSNHELGIEFARSSGVGSFDTEGNWVGIYPHYVFNNVNGVVTSDGGITFGFGIQITQGLYNEAGWARTVKNTYASDAPFIPITIPAGGRTTVVPGSSPMSLEDSRALMARRLAEEFEPALNNFLAQHGVTLQQHEFDALINFSYLHGSNVWTQVLADGNNWNISTLIQNGGPFCPDDLQYALTENFRQPQYDGRRQNILEVFLHGHR